MVNFYSWVLTRTYPGTPCPFCHGILSTYAPDFCQNSKPPPSFVLPKGIISATITPPLSPSAWLSWLDLPVFYSGRSYAMDRSLRGSRTTAALIHHCERKQGVYKLSPQSHQCVSFHEIKIVWGITEGCFQDSPHRGCLFLLEMLAIL